MEVMGQGLVLMIAGMAIVYVFLYVLILVSNHASRLVSKFDYLVPDEAPRKAKKVAVAAAPTASEAVSPAPSNGEKVTAPVPGTVLRISAANGSHVSKGDEILVMDVMKMETPFTAPCDGTVTICVAATDRISTGDVLAVVG